MKLKAISKFTWRGHDFIVGEIFEADELKGPLLVAEGHAEYMFDEKGSAVKKSEPMETDNSARDSVKPDSIPKNKKKK